MTVERMDNVGVVVEDIDSAIEFFTELGLELEGRAPVEGAWADGVTGLRDMRVEIGAGGAKFYLSGMSAKSRGLSESDLASKPAEFAMPNVLVPLALSHDRVLGC